MTMPEPALPPDAPGGLPLIGHAREMLFNRLDFLESLRGGSGIIAVKAGPRRIYVINDPALVREALLQRSSKLQASAEYRIVGRIIGNGLLLTDGPFHRQQRKLIKPAFHRPRIRGYADVIGQHAQTRFGGWHEGQQVNLGDEFGSLAAEVVLRCLFSTGIDQRQVTRITEGLTDFMTWAGSRGLDPTGLLARLPLPVNRRFRKSLDAVNGIIKRIIAERRAGEVTYDDLLSMLLSAQDNETGHSMADQQVRDEVMTLLIAGTESVSRTMAWSAYQIARNPRVQSKLYAEIEKVLPGHTVRFDDVERLPYLKLVLMETLRLYPPAYLVSRAAKEDITLGGYRIPAGSTMMVCYYALQRDPKVFTNPEHFDPERWSPERIAGTGRAAYPLFGIGPHSCPGEVFAWTEMTIVLATLATRWKLDTISPEPVKPLPTFSLQFDEIRMTVSDRAAHKHPAPSPSP